MSSILLATGQNAPLGRMGRAWCEDRPDWRVMRITELDALAATLEGRTPALLVIDAGFRCDEVEAAFCYAARTRPAMVRMLLASEPETAVAGLGAHQVFRECGSPTTFRTLVDAGLAVAGRLERNSRLAALLSGFHKVPTPPALYLDLRAAMQSRDGDLQSMARIASRDPAVAVEVLRLANSGFFARQRTVDDMIEAVQLVGTDLLLGIVLAARVFSGMPVLGIQLESLWHHGLGVATLAGQIAAAEGATGSEQSVCAVAGLLHDLGRVVLLENDPVGYQQLWRQYPLEQVLCAKEQDVYGATHAELGAAVLALWSMPEAVVEAVAHSHDWGAPLRGGPGDPVLIAEWLLAGSGADAPRTPGPTFADEVPEQRRQRWLEVYRDAMGAGS